jgi:hypothetical protein
MSLPAKSPQTLNHVLNQIAAWTVLYVLAAVVLREVAGTHLTPLWGFTTGPVIGLLNVIRDYHARPIEDRLAPRATMGLGGGGLVLWAVLVASMLGTPATTDWIVWLCLFAVALIPLYLLGTGVLQYRRDREASLRRRGGI